MTGVHCSVQGLLEPLQQSSKDKFEGLHAVVFDYWYNSC